MATVVYNQCLSRLVCYIDSCPWRSFYIYQILTALNILKFMSGISNDYWKWLNYLQFSYISIWQIRHCPWTFQPSQSYIWDVQAGSSWYGTMKKLSCLTRRDNKWWGLHVSWLFQRWHRLVFFINTVKPVLRGYFWDKEKMAS